MNTTTTTAAAREIIATLTAEGFDHSQITDAMCDGEYLGTEGIDQATSEAVLDCLATAEMFYRTDTDGNAVILDREDGEVITRIDADVYPVWSGVSARYELPDGIVLTVTDAQSIGILSETEYARANN